MFIDINSLDSFESEKLSNIDFCIIGAGAAGITLANKLSENGFKIALIESGGFLPGESQLLADGTTSGIDYMPLIGSRLRYFGGTTGHWAGQSAAFDKFDFTERSWVPNSGWPIEYDEYNQYIPEAADVCGVPRGGFHWSDITHTEKIEFPFSKKVFSDVALRYSSPTRRFGEYFRDQIEASDNIICLLNANVTELNASSNGRYIKSISIKSLNDKSFNLRANKFILACGGIENSRLLLASNSVIPNGIGNSNDMVGRYFMEHPNYDTSLITVSDLDKAKYLVKPTLERGSITTRLDFQLNTEQQEKLQILNHTAFFVHTNIKRDHMEESVDYMDKVKKKFNSVYNRLFGEDEPKLDSKRNFKLRIRLEQAPIADSRIILSNDKDVLGRPKAHLSMQFGNSEGKTIEEILKAIGKHLGTSSIGRIRIDHDSLTDEWKNKIGWQVHHCGGTRMSESPSKGVVDKNCKVHNVDNLWIAGSSVFPTSGHTNPTINLVALSLRLSKHLSEKV